LAEVEAKKLQKFLEAVKNKKKLAIEVKAKEKKKDCFTEADVIYLASENKEIYSFPLEESFFKKDLKDILSDTEIEKYGYDFKDKLLLLNNSDLNLKSITFDLRIAAHLLGFQLDKISLENFFSEEEILRKRLKTGNLLPLFQNIEMPLVEVLASMERAGITVKKEILIRISKELEAKQKRLTREIYEIAGESFNISSPKQLGLILFGKLGLPPVKKKKSGFSTDGEVLEILSKMHILPQKVLEYREISKLKSTYVDVLPGLISPRDGRLHTSYNQTVTSTGRLSSSNPNLQNIPIRGNWGKRLREAFTAQSADYFLLGADYSQIELRLLAHFSKDELLCQSFKNDEDIHTQTAQKIFELKSSRMNAGLRRMAKIINFGIIYGMSAYGLSRSLKIEASQAQDFIARYFEKYEGVKRYIENTIKEAKNKGYVTTMFGRRRYIPQVTSSNHQKKEFAYRVAVNTPIQGSAAEIIKLAMIKIWRQFQKRKLAAKMILQIHDELIMEIHKKEIEKVKILVKEEMERVVSLSVPLKVNLSLGRTWAEI